MAAFLEKSHCFLVEATVGLLCQGPDSGRSVNFEDHRGDLIGGWFFFQECVLKYIIKLRVPLSALRRWEEFSQGTAPAVQNYLDWAILCGLEPNPDSPQKRQSTCSSQNNRFSGKDSNLQQVVIWKLPFSFWLFGYPGGSKIPRNLIFGRRLLPTNIKLYDLWHYLISVFHAAEVYLFQPMIRANKTIKARGLSLLLNPCHVVFSRFRCPLLGSCNKDYCIFLGPPFVETPATLRQERKRPKAHGRGK